MHAGYVTSGWWQARWRLASMRTDMGRVNCSAELAEASAKRNARTRVCADRRGEVMKQNELLMSRI
jgi:hypothetical protein